MGAEDLNVHKNDSTEKVAEVAEQFVGLPADSPNVPNQRFGDTNGEFSDDVELDVFAELLLSDPTIKDLPPEIQTKLIMNRFMGALVRKGEVTNSYGDKLGVKDMVVSMKLAAHEADPYATDTKDKMPHLAEATSKGGLRAAVEKFLNDPRTRSPFAFNQYISERPILDGGVEIREVQGHEEVTLRNFEQIVGYLAAKPDQNKAVTLKVLEKIEETTLGTSLPGESWKELNDATFGLPGTFDDATFDQPLSESQKKAADWKNAVKEIEATGVDVYLLDRSVKAATENPGIEKKLLGFK